MSKRVKIEFEIEIPSNIKYTPEELEDWLRFEFRDNGLLDGDNPFNKANAPEPEPIFGTFEIYEK